MTRPLWDLVVVGAGPAGLSAATVAADRGLSVLVLDESDRPGGRLCGQLHERPGAGRGECWWNGLDIAEQLARSAYDANVKIELRQAVWGLFRERGDWIVATRSPDSSSSHHSRRVLLATGAGEDPLPLPGWDLPGVMSVGAAQVLANVHRVKPGRRAVVVGIDILSLTIARELTLAGVDVLAVVLPPNLSGQDSRADPADVVPRLVGLARFHPSPVLRLLGRAAQGLGAGRWAHRFYPQQGLPAWGMRVRARTACLQVVGREEAEGVVLVPLDRYGRPVSHQAYTLPVDVVCLAGGLTPLAELAAVAGCRFAHVPELGGQVPLHGPHYETTAERIYVAGNITGVESAEVALAQGTAAGLAIALDAEAKASPEEFVTALKRLKRIRAEADIHFLETVDAGRQELARRWEIQGA